jgi:hypothetical protein
MVSENTPSTVIDCACVIHGTGYDWIYVERLRNMLARNLSREVRMHVYTEAHREVPPHMVKHVLDEWPGIDGPRKSWWYKMQLFNPAHHQGDMLYFDLDVAIVDNIDWMVTQTTEYFWTIRDFRYLQKEKHNAMNSSAMWFNVSRFGWIWDEFCKSDIAATTRRYQGDQDYLQVMLTHEHKRYYDRNRFQSWRWQCVDGGYNFASRKFNKPGAGATLAPETAVIVFHGQPKPHQIQDPVVVNFWQ